MAKEVNEEYQKFYNDDFFTFEDTEDIFGDNPPTEILKIRKELEKQYRS